MFSKPRSVLPVIWHNRSDRVPKLSRVIMENGVHELMNDDIVHHCQRSQDEPPGEAQRACGTAGSPACTGRGNSNSFVFKIKLAGKEIYPFRQDLPSLFPVPTLEGGGGIALMGGSQFECPVEE